MNTVILQFQSTAGGSPDVLFFPAFCHPFSFPPDIPLQRIFSLGVRPPFYNFLDFQPHWPIIRVPPVPDIPRHMFFYRLVDIAVIGIITPLYLAPAQLNNVTLVFISDNLCPGRNQAYFSQQSYSVIAVALRTGTMGFSLVSSPVTDKFTLVRYIFVSLVLSIPSTSRRVVVETHAINLTIPYYYRPSKTHG